MGQRVPALELCCPTELPAKMGMSYICATLSKQPCGPRGRAALQGEGQVGGQQGISHLTWILAWLGEFTQGCPVPWPAGQPAGPGQTPDRTAPPPACLPQPVCLDAMAYLRAALPSTLLVGLCLLQAFGYRLRRVIATFYFPKVCPALPSPPLHTPNPSLMPSLEEAIPSALSLSLTPCPWPQREKKRTLFFYNELLRKRAAFTQLRRAAIVRQARQQRAPVSPDLGSWAPG